MIFSLVANVNYGLVAEWSIPESELTRHKFISFFPMGEFILVSVLLARATQH